MGYIAGPTRIASVSVVAEVPRLVASSPSCEMKNGLITGVECDRIFTCSTDYSTVKKTRATARFVRFPALARIRSKST